MMNFEILTNDAKDILIKIDYNSIVISTLEKFHSNYIFEIYEFRNK